jgi:1,4-dihydroxy-2-naphthoate octaprenyltransferase
VVWGLANLGLYFRVVRPHIVAGGFLGYSLGVLLALLRGGAFHLNMFILGYAVVLFGDLSTHFSNDYFDVELDRVSPRKTFDGSNTLVEHPEVRSRALSVAVALSAASMLSALSMVHLFGSPPLLLALVAVSSFFGWFYSAPPIRLNARGLGEATIALGTGFAVPAVGFIATAGAIDQAFLRFSAPLVLYGFMLSLSLEIPDLEVDREYGKRNLVVLLGRRPAAILILLLSVSATALFSIYESDSLIFGWVVPLLSVIPMLASLAGFLARSDSQAEADRASVINISALSLFLVALDGYLLSKVI